MARSGGRLDRIAISFQTPNFLESQVGTGAMASPNIAALILPVGVAYEIGLPAGARGADPGLPRLGREI